LRVEKIKKMLKENPDKELEYLSNTCGFSSSSHMSSTFKKITGETLNEYRKRIKKSMEE
jgi:transcriptional regulator GlxA family with amidase domain